MSDARPIYWLPWTTRTKAGEPILEKRAIVETEIANRSKPLVGHRADVTTDPIFFIAEGKLWEVVLAGGTESMPYIIGRGSKWRANWGDSTFHEEGTGLEATMTLSM